jgi:hypothetical protein
MNLSDSLVVLAGSGLLFALVGGVSCDLQSAAPADLVGAAAGCPDVSSASAAAKADWAKEFGIDVEVGKKIKAGVVAALELDAFAGKIDADLVAGCGGLATDLGKAGPYKNGSEACKAAIDAMAAIKAKMGAGVKMSLVAQPPHCAASLDAAAQCVAECEANVDPGSVEVKCEPGKLSGQCEAECKGSCELQAAAKCEGTCNGSCDAKFSGSCAGKCDGKCDGKTSKGASCAGKCEGTCTAGAEGSCGGKCEGECKLSGAAKCEGTCHGDCSVQMKAPKCEGEVEPPKASAECKAQCNAKLQAQVECTPPRVALAIEGGADAAAVAKYKAAIEKNLPLVLKVAVGMKDGALKAAGNVKAVVEGVQVAVKSAGSAQVGARIAACVAAPFKAAFDAAASVQANVSVSVDVQASASASGSASGSAKTGL